MLLAARFLLVLSLASWGEDDAAECSGGFEEASNWKVDMPNL